MTSRPRTVLTGLGAAVALLAVIAGVPWLLIHVAGGALPHQVPTLEHVRSTLSRPDDGTLLLGTFAVVAWLAWASFTASILTQAVAQLRHIHAPHVPGLIGAHTAGRLVAAVLALGALSALGITAASPAQAATDAPHSTASTSQAQVPQSTPASARTVTRQVPHIVTVRTGDTLSGIAEQEYHDGNDWPAIYRANRGAPQAGGHLDDPDLIQPGLKLSIPGRHDIVTVPAKPAAAPVAPTPGTTTHDATPPAAQPDSTPSGNANGRSPQATPSPTATQPASQATPGAAAVAQTPDAAQQRPAAPADRSPVRLVTGLSTLAAAGVLLLLFARRARQSRTRRPGQRITLPAGAGAVAEAQLRAGADPLTVHDVDHALRLLARAATPKPLPALRAVRITPDALELYLVDETATLPAPAQPVNDEPATWQISRDQLPQPPDVDELTRDTPAPYPTLVTLGHDTDGAHLLLHLEEIRTLAVTGPAARDALTALTLELIASQWGDDVTVTLVGILPELAEALGSDRVTYVDELDQVLPALEYTAAAHTRAMAEADVSTSTQARAAGLHPQTWTPHLVITGSTPTTDQARRVNALTQALPRVAIATVIDGEPLGPWQLNLTDRDHAQLLPAHIALTPQVLGGPDLDALVEAFHAADAPHQPGPSWAETVHEEATLDDLPDTLTPDTLDDLDTLSDLAQTLNPADPAEPTPTPGGVLAGLDHVLDDEPNQAPTQDRAPILDDGDLEDLDETNAQLLLPPDQPVLRLLGPVRVDNAPGPRPNAPGTALKILTHLALNPGGGADELDQAVWPGQDKKHTTRDAPISKARSWLGTAPDGHPYVAFWTPDQGYRLADDLTTDWDVFTRLIGDDIAQADTHQLTAALALVYGKPISNRGFSETAAQAEIIAAIADVAHELATRASTTGHATRAIWAASKGLDVEPVHEILWRDLLRATHQSGDHDALTDVITRYNATMDALDGDHDPDTDDLIAQITQPLAV